MTHFGRKLLILNANTRKFGSARVAQIMPYFKRKMFILNAKSPKFPPARVAQIMTNS